MIVLYSPYFLRYKRFHNLFLIWKKTIYMILKIQRFNITFKLFICKYLLILNTFSTVLKIFLFVLFYWLLILDLTYVLILTIFCFKKCNKVGCKLLFNINWKLNTHHTASIKTHLLLRAPERSTHIVLSPSSSQRCTPGGGGGGGGAATGAGAGAAGLAAGNADWIRAVLVHSAWRL